MEEKMDKEEMVGYMLTQCKIRGGEHKRQAVERYMRTYFRALTAVELAFELKYLATNRSVSPPIQFKIDQASQGYDSFMAKHRAKVA